MLTHHQFYSALPKHKAELIDGHMYVGGSLRKSAMVMGYMVEKLGAAYVLDLCPKELLQEAVLEVYGPPREEITRLADFTPVEPSYYRPQKLATDLRLGLFRRNGIDVSGGTTVIKLGDDAFMPDVYVIREAKRTRLSNYYLDGTPDLIIEVVHPYMREFDYGLRMERYAAAGVPELWMLDFANRSFEPHSLVGGKFVRQEVTGKRYVSTSIPEISVRHERLYDTAQAPGIQLTDDIFEVGFPEKEREKIPYREGYGYHSMPFAPRLALEPVSITFREFISWGGEVKFELFDGKPVFGGGDETTREWLGLLLMTLGVKEAVKYLPEEEWAKAL